MRITGPDIFVKYASKCLIKRDFEDTNSKDFKDDWLGHFGTMPKQCFWIWSQLDPCATIGRTAHPRHLLWALYFLRVYPAEKGEEVLWPSQTETLPKRHGGNGLTHL